jgi:hypothetical protein
MISSLFPVAHYLIRTYTRTNCPDAAHAISAALNRMNVGRFRRKMPSRAFVE